MPTITKVVKHDEYADSERLTASLLAKGTFSLKFFASADALALDYFRGKQPRLLETSDGLLLTTACAVRSHVGEGAWVDDHATFRFFGHVVDDEGTTHPFLRVVVRAPSHTLTMRSGETVREYRFDDTIATLVVSGPDVFVVSPKAARDNLGTMAIRRKRLVAGVVKLDFELKQPPEGARIALVDDTLFDFVVANYMVGHGLEEAVNFSTDRTPFRVNEAGFLQTTSDQDGAWVYAFPKSAMP